MPVDNMHLCKVWGNHWMKTADIEWSVWQWQLALPKEKLKWGWEHWIICSSLEAKSNIFTVTDP